MKELKLAEMRARPLCSRMMGFGLAEPRRSGWGTRTLSQFHGTNFIKRLRLPG